MYASSSSVGLSGLGSAGSLHGTQSSLSFLCAARPQEGGERGLAMTSTEADPSVRRANAAARKDDALIGRAAKRTGLAGAALASAAWHLDNAHGHDGNALTGLAELVRDEAGRVSNLVADIESHRKAPGDDG